MFSTRPDLPSHRASEAMHDPSSDAGPPLAGAPPLAADAPAPPAAGGAFEAGALAAGPSPALPRLLAHLQACVTQHARERRARGVPVERVIPEVRRLVREAEAREGWADPTDGLLARVVRWSVDAYYAAPGPRGAGRPH